MPEQVLSPKLAAKLVAAMKSIDAVTKSGSNVDANNKLKYKYVTAADVGHEVREALAEHGIAFTYTVKSIERFERPTASGGSMLYCQAEVEATFTDAESGDSFPFTCFGWGSDNGDKGIYKAFTGALKYGLRMNFIIPDDADPENEKDSGDETRGQKPVTRASQQPATTFQRQLRASVQEIRKPNGREAAEAILSTLVPEPGDIGPDDVPLDAYENMDADPPPERAKPQPVPVVGPPIGAKKKVLFAIAMSKGWTAQMYRNWVNQMGYAKDDDIPLARFSALKEHLESL
jgi:hypothetical protein